MRGYQSFGHMGSVETLAGMGTLLCETTPLGSRSARVVSGYLPEHLSSSEALEPRLGSTTISRSAISEQGLETIQVHSCLTSWLWFTKNCLGKEGRGQSVSVGALLWVETDRTPL